MWYIPLIVVAAFALVFGLGKAGNLYAMKKVANKNTAVNKENMPMVTNILSKKEVAERLKELSKSPVPKINEQMGAMCYEPAMPPERAEYICPTCSNKTLYLLGEAEKVEWLIPSLRSAVAQVKGLDIRLNESEFCKTCSPDALSPRLYVDIYYKDENKTNRAVVYNVEDIYLLQEFVKGSLIHQDTYDNREPLKNQIKRLQELLGVKLD